MALATLNVSADDDDSYLAAVNCMGVPGATLVTRRSLLVMRRSIRRFGVVSDLNVERSGSAVVVVDGRKRLGALGWSNRVHLNLLSHSAFVAALFALLPAERVRAKQVDGALVELLRNGVAREKPATYAARVVASGSVATVTDVEAFGVSRGTAASVLSLQRKSAPAFELLRSGAVASCARALKQLGLELQTLTDSEWFRAAYPKFDFDKSWPIVEPLPEDHGCELVVTTSLQRIPNLPDSDRYLRVVSSCLATSNQVRGSSRWLDELGYAVDVMPMGVSFTYTAKGGNARTETFGLGVESLAVELVASRLREVVVRPRKQEPVPF
jgi:hypothetical protein